MITMKRARMLFANRSFVVRKGHDSKGAEVDVKVRKRNPRGPSFRAWVRQNAPALGPSADLCPKLKRIVDGGARARQAA